MIAEYLLDMEYCHNTEFAIIDLKYPNQVQDSNSARMLSHTCRQLRSYVEPSMFKTVMAGPMDFPHIPKFDKEHQVRIFSETDNYHHEILRNNLYWVASYGPGLDNSLIHVRHLHMHLDIEQFNYRQKHSVFHHTMDLIGPRCMPGLEELSISLASGDERKSLRAVADSIKTYKTFIKVHMTLKVGYHEGHNYYDTQSDCCAMLNESPQRNRIKSLFLDFSFYNEFIVRSYVNEVRFLRGLEVLKFHNFEVPVPFTGSRYNPISIRPVGDFDLIACTSNLRQLRVFEFWMPLDRPQVNILTGLLAPNLLHLIISTHCLQSVRWNEGCFDSITKLELREDTYKLANIQRTLRQFRNLETLFFHSCKHDPSPILKIIVECNPKLVNVGFGGLRIQYLSKVIPLLSKIHVLDLKNCRWFYNQIDYVNYFLSTELARYDRGVEQYFLVRYIARKCWWLKELHLPMCGNDPKASIHPVLLYDLVKCGRLNPHLRRIHFYAVALWPRMHHQPFQLDDFEAQFCWWAKTSTNNISHYFVFDVAKVRRLPNLLAHVCNVIEGSIAKALYMSQIRGYNRMMRTT